ncbi:MAG TPA: amidohydrolase, partial [Chloroflexota bacterium]|nr:amidohydrolase [Chloroflexota bacterium]
AAGHGCGHNLLGVGSLGAAVALKEAIRAEGLHATVRYYGCPAEETAIGKVFMAREGAFDDLDAALSWHPGGVNMATGCSSLALNSVKFAFHGRSAHASAAPHMGISALDAVELMNVGVNYLREHVTPEARIHYVITDGGSEPNVVPANAEAWYYIRAPHRHDVEEIYQRILKIAEGAALMTGAGLEVKFQAGLYDILPNPVLIELLERSMVEVGVPSFTPEEMEFAKGIEASFSSGMKEAAIQGHHLPAEMATVILHDQVMPCSDRGTAMWASTDVGDVSWIVPTGQVNAASYVFGTPAHSWQAVAAAGMSIGQKSMLTAARSLALGGYRLVTQPELLSQAWEAFDKARGGHKYVSPVPADVAPPDPHLDGH